MTYAATGAGCTGAVGASTGFRTDRDAPSVIRPSDVTAPVRHGPFLLHPPDWTGALEAPVPLPRAAAGGAQAAPAPFHTTDIAVARGHPLWREPALPAGWRFGSAGSGGEGFPADGYEATYSNGRGYYGARITVVRISEWPFPVWATDNGEGIREARMIDGRWAVVEYTPPGRPQFLSTAATIFDEAIRIVYVVRGLDRNMRGSNVGPVIEIARSLYCTPAR